MASIIETGFHWWDLLDGELPRPPPLLSRPEGSKRAAVRLAGPITPFSGYRAFICSIQQEDSRRQSAAHQRPDLEPNDPPEAALATTSSPPRRWRCWHAREALGSHRLQLPQQPPHRGWETQLMEGTQRHQSRAGSAPHHPPPHSEGPARLNVSDLLMMASRSRTSRPGETHWIHFLKAQFTRKLPTAHQRPRSALGAVILDRGYDSVILDLRLFRCSSKTSRYSTSVEPRYRV